MRLLKKQGKMFVGKFSRIFFLSPLLSLSECKNCYRLNSIALEERRNEINEKLAKKDRKKKKKKKEKKQKGSKDSGASDTNSTGPSNYTHMTESESTVLQNNFTKFFNNLSIF